VASGLGLQLSPQENVERLKVAAFPYESESLLALTAYISHQAKGLPMSVAIDGPPGKADVWVAVADDHDQNSVNKGENKGRTINHVAVVRSLGKVGSLKKGEGFEKTLRIPLKAPQADMRVVVFLSEAMTGPVLGAAQQALQ